MRVTQPSDSPNHGRPVMDSEEILNHYQWSPGTCFRHPADGEVETAVVKTIRPRHGGQEAVLACRDCVLTMEDQRREAAVEDGFSYEPGRVGQELRRG